MTLYLLFEQLEAGKLKLDSQLQSVARTPPRNRPPSSGCKPGSTITVEDAIKGIVTRSANDAAVVVAEAIAGDEDDFAELMTQQGARARHEPHRLPERVRPAGRRAGHHRARPGHPGPRHPGALPALLQIFLDPLLHVPRPVDPQSQSAARTVEGVDGIKTGYIRASGFNLVTSVHRGNRHIVAVVMGGGSAGSRDARMRDLISEHIAQSLDQAHRADGRGSGVRIQGL